MTRSDLKGKVEEAIALFSELDSDLDKLEVEVDAWRRSLLGAAERLARKASDELMELARKEGERMVSERETKAREEAEKILEDADRRVQELSDKIDRVRDELMKMALDGIMPQVG